MTGKNEDPEGFVDFGLQLSGFNPRPVLAVSAARDVGRLVGMVPKAEVEDLRAELAAAQEQIDALHLQLEEQDEFKRAVDYTFKGINKLRRAPGPAPQRAAA
jgi:hypothetical protein